MRRVITVLLVGALAFPASGCATLFPTQPTVTTSRDVVVDRRASGTIAAQEPDAPPVVPTSEFRGSNVAGIAAGVALVGALALFILAKGGSGNEQGAAGAGAAP